ncbi:helix-turn-helix domain-containing protein [Nocardia terpenica]|uniref:helix-turn-helix domain-containing protein n=1 Tax=Nocardia terpenica TaxID=455432 RepID=UPI00142E3D3A|nr:helix-turn-helix transcriptional regulator [Nocardia terpenica]
MTTLAVVDDGASGETRSQAVARRLRGVLGENRITISELGRRIGMTQSAMSRRVNGDTSFTIEELDRVADAIGTTFLYLSTGIKEIA